MPAAPFVPRCPPLPRRPPRRCAPAARLAAALAAAAACGGRGDAGARDGPRDGARDGLRRRADTVVVVAAPRPDPAPVAGDTAYRRRAGYVVDSVRPLEEELRRFRAGLPRPATLGGGAASREALVRRFLDALARRDSAALARMALTRAEFAWLVYPSSPLMRPPYRQPPGLVWLQLEAGGRPGLRRLLDRFGGRAPAYAGHACDAAPAVEGENRLWRGCRVTLVPAPGDTIRARLFGVVVERRGRFKFANFASDF
jgi:hypothetical protein